MKLRLLIALAVGLLVAGYWSVLPPASHVMEIEPDPRVIAGAIHVHTERSDGTGTVEDVARAAEAAGLDFVLLTDHGDGTRPPMPPSYRHGVLVIDGVEISTTGGHYLAAGIPTSPYPLGGLPADVIEDVRRLGGFGMAAHPDSPKAELRWRDWQAPFDGIEWLNADSAWRDERRAPLARVMLTYWVRAPESIVALFDRPSTAIARWDALARRRPVAGVAGHDAHARVSLRGNWEPGEGDRSLGLPSYAAAFRTFSNRVLLDAPLTRTADGAAQDAARVLAAVRAGRSFTLLDALATPARLEFHASGPCGNATMGDRLPECAVELRAQVVPAPEGATIHLLRNGERWRTSSGAAISAAHEAAPGGAEYRVEVELPGAPGTPPVPWLVSNPIVVGAAEETAPPPRPPASVTRPVVRPAGRESWIIERHPQSASELTVADEGWRWQWRLAEGRPSGQYAAIVAPVPPKRLAGMDRVVMQARASRPMRVSVQLRIPDGEGLRWRRSVYVDQMPREVTVFFDDMLPIEAAPGTRLDLARVDSLLIVADTVNAKPGDSGEVWISDVRWGGGEGTSGPHGQQHVRRSRTEDQVRTPRREDR